MPLTIPGGSGSPRGYQGLRGTAGAAGAAGAVGARGPQGAPGAPGPVNYRGGSVTFSNQMSRPVTFSSPLPSASYEVLFNPNGMAGTFTVTGQTASGFTANCGTMVTGTLNWLAIMLQ